MSMPKRHGSSERDSPTRRSFIKSVTAGAVAAAGLAAAAPALAGATAGAGGVTAGGARHLRVAFQGGGLTTLEDVRKAIESAVGFAGCTRCGFDGIDLTLRQEEILGPEPDPWIVTTWEGF
jgi:hypothetical protein